MDWLKEPTPTDPIWYYIQNEGANMSDFKKTINNAFQDEDYRHGYADEFLNSYIATQIKVLREQRGWSQKELADRADMLQPRISALENVNYSSWSIKILRRLAEAFDLTLNVSFESFGERLEDFDNFSRENLERPSFPDDPYFKDPQESLASTDSTKYQAELPDQGASTNVLYLEDDYRYEQKVSLSEASNTSYTAIN